MIDKGVCDKGFILNPSNYEGECDKSCDVGQYLDYENLKCRKKLNDKLVEEYTEDIDETKIAGITSMELHSKMCVNILAHCTLCYFKVLYNQHWNWYLFCLPQVHES